MADIELVIKIPEEEYINIKNAINSLIENGVERASMSKVCLAILDGTPLPKGHGDLIDRKELLKQPIDNVFYPSNYVRTAPPIIEADKKYEVEIITRGNCMMCGKELTEGLFFCNECEDKASSRK